MIRLAHYTRGCAADEQFWSRHWQEQIRKQRWDLAEQGFLGWFEEPFTRYLPKNEKILEAGCGLGYYVVALSARGYQIEGIEWSKDTVNLFKRLYPKLSVRAGDVRKLSVNDGTFGGYISLGVVEHDRKGPEVYFREAYRVLKPGGVALISVPHFNFLRMMKALIGCYHKRNSVRVIARRPEFVEGRRGNLTSGHDLFYQYVFQEREFDRLLRSAGFTVVRHFRYDAYKGLKDELPFLRRILTFLARVIPASLAESRRAKAGIYTNYLYRFRVKHGMTRNTQIFKTSYHRPLWLKFLEYFTGHMTLAVCVKKPMRRQEI